MTELEEKIKQADIERKRRYPLLDITDNRQEIQHISRQTQDYLQELKPELVKIRLWEAIPRIVIQFIQAVFTEIKKEKIVEVGISSVILGDICEMGIEYTKTSDGDKFGNITPFCICRSEWKYENISLPYIDEVPLDVAAVMTEEGYDNLPVQFFDNRKQVKDISINAMKSLHDYGIKFGVSVDDTKNWWIIPLVFIAFMRKSREFLIEHKDDGDIGVTINFANYISFGIRKEGGLEEDDPVDYTLFIVPEQIFKKDNAKDDGLTEVEA